MPEIGSNGARARRARRARGQCFRGWSLLVVAACGGSSSLHPFADGGHDTRGAEETGSTSGPGSVSEGASSAPATATAESSSGGMGRDLGTGSSSTSGGGEAGGMGCDKIDFLFVVDDSPLMEDEQGNLAASFPRFMDEVGTTLGVRDHHVMVVDVDAETCCSDGSGCQNPDCATLGPEPADTCHNALGAGVVHPWGIASSNRDCGLDDGRRYMLDTQADLDATFACVARVGLSGWTGARPAGAAMAAVSEALNAPGGCNEGFLRDDAILVITIVMAGDDEPPDDGPAEHWGTPGEPADWYAALVAAKGGRSGSVALLALLSDGDQPFGVCPPESSGGPSPSPRLRELFGMFSAAQMASVCSADYANFFSNAVGPIKVACDRS